MASFFRASIVIALSILSIFYTLGSLGYSPLLQNKLKLGLDLQGGVHLLLEVDLDSYIKDQNSLLLSSVKKSLRDKRLYYKNAHISDNKISITIPSEESYAKVRKALHSPEITINNNGNKVYIYYTEEKINDMKEKVLEQSLEIIRMRIDEDGTKEPSLQKQGEKYILLQVPGLSAPGQLKEIIGTTAKLGFYKVMQQGERGARVISSQDGYGAIAVENKASISGDMLVDAQATIHEGNPVVSFEFNNIGTKLFASLSQAQVYKPIAIVLDDKLLSAPVVNQPILGGKGIISGSFTIEKANELALLLRAGALPAPLKIIEERTVGPSLGKDSIESGKKAGVIAMIAVMIFMVMSYATFGIIANISMLITLTYICASLSLLQATLTLPGIAGIILTIGMAVDANVLIYENIREELKGPVSVAFAVKQGFKNAFGTIADSNITTLAAVILLYIFGIGTIRGFAITLGIGIVASMFSSILISRMLINAYIKIVKPRKLLL